MDAIFIGCFINNDALKCLLFGSLLEQHLSWVACPILGIGQVKVMNASNGP